MLSKKNKHSIICILIAIVLIMLSLSFSVNATNQSSKIISATKNQRPTGALPDTRPTTPDKNSNLANFSSKSLPSDVDLSQSVSFPPVRDQGDLNSCVAWATAYYQFGYQVAAMNSWDVRNDVSKQFSPKWVYNFINSGLNKGTLINNAYTILSVHGNVRFSQCTPTGIDTPSEYASWYLNEDALEQALKYRIVENEHLAFASITSSTPIISFNSDCLTTMKSFLNEGHILVIGTDFDEWQYQTLVSQSSSNLNGQKVCIKAIDSDNTTAGHQMAIVGYNDAISFDLDGNGTIQDFEKGAFKLVNSHGTNYGNSGFIWVMYDALNKVSNATVQNNSYRRGIFNNNAYDIISVEEFPVDLIAKITIRQDIRNQTDVNMGVSYISDVNPVTSVDTLVDFNRPYGTKNYSGTTGFDEATFVFDYGNLFNLYGQRMKYYVTISDRPIEPNYTTIKKVELIDNTDKTVVSNTTTRAISGSTFNYIYKLGLVGDVDNNGKVNTRDATSIQKYVADAITQFPNGKVLLLP